MVMGQEAPKGRRVEQKAMLLLLGLETGRKVGPETVNLEV